MSAPTPSEEPRRAAGLWPWIAERVTSHPGWASLLAVVLLAPMLLALPAVDFVNDALGAVPQDVDSVEGFEALERHFPPGELAPVLVVIDDDEPVTERGSFRALQDLSKNLRRLDAVAGVRSVAMPTNGQTPDTSSVEGADETLSGVTDLESQLDEAATGAEELADGTAQLADGIGELQSRLPELDRGLSEAADGSGQLAGGLEEFASRSQELIDGVEQLRSRLPELEDGLTEARDGVTQLRDEVAAPADDAIREAWDALYEDFTVGRGDPAYGRAVESVGQAFGRITGDDPTTGMQADLSYPGLTASLDELATGLTEAVDGVGELRAGVGELSGGLSEAQDGLAELAAGAGELRDGLAEADSGIGELRAGVDELATGSQELAAGADELATGLREGVVQLRDTGFQDLLPSADPETDGPFVLTHAMLEMDAVAEQVDYFLAEDETRTRLLLTLDEQPFSPEGLDAVPEIEEVAGFSLEGSPLDDATVLVSGTPAFLSDLDDVSFGDLPLIMISVLLGVFLVLVVLLRALVAPAWMVLTTLVSFGASLGASVIVFQGMLGDRGLAWYIPPFLFVILVAVGADYTIYLVSRIREEAETRTTRAAVERATAASGGVITSAGIILAGTFFALVFADMRPMAQMGFAVASGVLIDTLIVRTLLVPSVATALGRLNWWPSRRGRHGLAAAGAGGAGDGGPGAGRDDDPGDAPGRDGRAGDGGGAAPGDNGTDPSTAPDRRDVTVR